MPDSLAQLADEDLARRARAGSSSALEELIRRFQVPLLRFLTRRIPRRCDAEDILQESMIRMYQSLDRYDDAWPFRTWIFTITHRLAINHLRKTTTRREDPLPDDRPDTSQPPDHHLDRQEQSQRLWDKARGLLSEEQLAAVWLFYVEEMSAPQIAHVLGRSWVGVKTMLHRARKRLMESLRELVNVEDTCDADEVIASSSIAAGEP